MIWSGIGWVLACIILACLLVAIATDITNRIIPNRLVLVVLSCGIGLRLVSGSGALLASLLSAIAIVGALSLLGAYDLLGWGDVKLIAAVTFAVPASHVIALLLAITMAGGLLSCLYLVTRFVLRRAARRPRHDKPDDGGTWPLRRLVRGEAARILLNEPMPYALAIAGGLAYSLAAG
jgi:prepilin peptidase CpaA